MSDPDAVYFVCQINAALRNYPNRTTHKAQHRQSGTGPCCSMHWGWGPGFEVWNHRLVEDDASFTSIHPRTDLGSRGRCFLPLLLYTWYIRYGCLLCPTTYKYHCSYSYYSTVQDNLTLGLHRPLAVSCGRISYPSYGE